MPRRAREKSKSGIYHVMLRGINRQTIFEDKEDNQKFLDTLLTYKPICGYELYAYCFMGNHVHLLIREGKESLEQAFKRIAGSYVYWYNHMNLNDDVTFPCECDPIHLVRVQACKLLDKTSSVEDLYNIAIKWGSYIAEN